VSTLASHLIAHWDLTTDETDAVGSLDLTEEGTVTYGANGAELGGGANFLKIPVASAGALQLGTDSQSCVFTFEVDTLPASQTQLVSFGGNWISGLDDGWGVHLNSSGQLLFRFSDGSSWAGFSGSGTISTATPYTVCISMYRAGSMFGFVNGAQVGSASISTYSATSLTATRDFEIGGDYTGGQYFDGRIKYVSIFNINLSSDADAINLLYNGGTPWGYSDITAFNGPWVRSRWAGSQETNTTSHSPVVGLMKSGDMVIHHTTTDGNTASTLAISEVGFAELFAPTVVNPASNPATLGAWYEVIDSDDKYTSLTTTWTGSERASSVTLVISNPGSIEDIEAITNATDSTPDGPTTTVTTPGLVIYGVGHDQNTAISAAPSGVLVLGNANVATTAGTRTAVGRNRPSSAGTFGPGTWTLGGGFNSVTFGYHVQGVSTAATIEPDDASVSVAGDATTISQVHSITPNAGTVSVAGQEATISQVHSLTPADGVVGVSGEATTITQVHVIVSADGSVSVSATATTVSDGAVLQPADGSVSVAATATTISQVHILLPADGSVSVSAAIAAIIQNHVFTPTAGSVAVTVENATVTQITPTTLGGAVSAMGAGIGALPAMGSGIGALSTLGN
jgi:hypothetical protein